MNVLRFRFHDLTGMPCFDKEIFLQYANRVVASRQKRQQVKCKLNFQSKERVCFGFRAFICFRESLIPFAIGLSNS